MKKKVLALLLMAALFCFTATAALAAPAQLEFIYPEDSAQYTWVFDVTDHSVDTDPIFILGMSTDYQVHELTAEEEGLLLWTIPSGDAAQFSNGQKTYTGNNPVITVTGRDEDITVTCYYDYNQNGIDDSDVSVPIFLVGETNVTSIIINGVTVGIHGQDVGDFTLPNQAIPLYDRADLAAWFGGNKNDYADVLNYNPSALSALLYALETHYGYDWVAGNVKLDSEGAYVSDIDGDGSADGYWTYTVNGDDPGHAAGAHWLHQYDAVTWTFNTY